MEDLLTLRGVGRKVANLIRGDIFGLGGIVADTHCIRISGRLGLSNGKDPLKTERDLEKLIPIEKQSDYCHRMVLFGREVCIARRPKCDECELKEICTYKDEK
jgi:endonuclease-3